MTILLVDDMSLMLKTMITIIKLHAASLNILTAESGYEAIRVMQDNPVDIVVCDYSMPNGNGGEVYKYIKEKHPKVTFVLNSHLRLSEMNEFKECSQSLMSLDKTNIYQELKAFLSYKVNGEKEITSGRFRIPKF